MHELICTDETFDPNFTIEYKLSIQVGLDGFSFCIQDNIRKKYLVFKHFPFRLSNPLFLSRKINEIFEREKILSLKYKEVKILIESPYFSAIPNAPEFEQNPEVYLRQNFNIPSDSEFQTFKNDFFDCSIIFSYSKQLNSTFEDKFEKYILTHQIQSAFKTISLNNYKNGIHAFINATSQYYNLLIFENKRLLFLNSFKYKNEQDFLYFLLTTLKSLSVYPGQLKVSISGHVNEQSAIHKLLEQHIVDVNFIKFNSSFQYSYTFEKFPQHQFASIINPEG